MKPSGAKTTIVASVDAVIAGPTSTVASRAARHLSLDPCMFRYTFSSTTMLSSTTLPTEIARPPNVMKFSASPCQLISRTAMKMLSGIESAITTVGRRDVKAPTIAFGRSVRKNTNTTSTARTSPRIASRSSVVIWLSMIGPSSETITTSTPAGNSPTSSSASSTAVVTSIVFASGSLIMDTPMLGLPLVRDMLVAVPRAQTHLRYLPQRNGRWRSRRR